ncbi:MAG: hypothetical protein J1E34_03575 [Oscillospiraceae bacterium]|nr:hypothetical protein [Oscillospiraceae bacterium]
MAKENKKFNYGLYAAITFTIVTLILVLITVFTFKGRYIAFNGEKVAVNYTDTILQRGDGYNAYKYTISAKSSKYGDFVRVNYMYPLIYTDYTPGADTKKLSGLNADANKSDATKNDDGTLAGQLADKMFACYKELINQYGWDNYDAVYTNYFTKLIEVRKEIFGDDYLSDAIMFSAIEANVASYGDSLTGTKKVVAADGKTVIQEESTGLYQTVFGENYKLTASVTGSESVEDLAAYKASLDPAVLETYGITADDISEARAFNLDISDGSETIAQVVVYEVKIGNIWYVDNLSTDTSAIYQIAK